MESTAGNIGRTIREKLGLPYSPVGMYYTDTRPGNATGFKNKGNGCIVPLIFTAAKGKTVAIDRDSTGWDCSAFYLGYQEWIFKGIECFLSSGTVWGRKGERFIKSPQHALEFVQSWVPERLNDKITVFKPLEEFNPDETPELVIFFVNPDHLSGLVFLLHYHSPDRDDLVSTRFMSGCGSLVTVPMRYKAEGSMKAVWGMHDLSARLRLPPELMTLTMPYEMLRDIAGDIDESFIITDTWKRIMERGGVKGEG